MRRVLLDVNVVLDAVLDRSPHAEAAMQLWAAIEARQVLGFIPAHGVTTMFYLFARARGAASAGRMVADILEVYRAAAVDQVVLRRALTLGWSDFEDAVCAATAEAAGCDLIVTRDPAGFKGSPVPTVNPASALALFDRGGDPGGVAELPRTYRHTASRRRRASA